MNPAAAAYATPPEGYGFVGMSYHPQTGAPSPIFRALPKQPPLPEVSVITEMFWEVVRIHRRDEVKATFSKQPLGMAVFYNSSQDRNAICIIVNNPGVRKLDIEAYIVHKVSFQSGVLARMPIDQQKNHVTAYLQTLFPRHMKLYGTEQEAAQALNNAPYAIWGSKDTCKVAGSDRMGMEKKEALFDEFGILFSSDPVIEVLESLTGTGLFRQLKGNSEATTFHKYRLSILEERVALLNSFKKAVHNHSYKSAAEAIAFIEEQACIKKEFERWEQRFIQPVAFYTDKQSGDLLPVLHMLYVHMGETRLIPIKDYDKLTADHTTLLNDVRNLNASLPQNEAIDVDKLALFEVQADREAVRKIAHQIFRRRG